MPRQDYDEIKSKFERMAEQIRTYNSENLEDLMMPDASVYLSTVKEDRNGKADGINGMKRFIDTYPRTDELKTDIFHFTARINKDEAQQSGYLVCCAMNQAEEGKVKPHFIYCHIWVNHWKKENGSWKMDSIRMELFDGNGDLQSEFEKVWHMEDRLCQGIVGGIHPLTIEGDLDSPWHVILQPEPVLTDEEQIIEAVAEFNFGIDFLAFDHLEDVLSDDFCCTGSTKEKLGNHKHERMRMLKLHRQPHRLWTHAYVIKKLLINCNEATVVGKRIIGHDEKESGRPWITGKKDEKEMRCFLTLKMRKEEQRWKITEFNYESYEVPFE